MRASPFFCAAVALFALGAGCNCGGDAVVDQPGLGDGGGTTGGDGDGGTSTGGDGGSQTGPVAPFPKEQACESISDEASLSKKPVDIIMVIDNSCSMSVEIEAVENNVNQNFAQIIEQSGVDYRVILIAKHGSASASQSVCIKAPLSGTSCNPIPAQPVNGARFFHYDIEISSTNSLTRAIDTYDTTDVHNFAPGGWSSWLRPGSIKTFIEITDDLSSITADAFESQLFALPPLGTFGDAQQRNYIFHSIIGIVPNSPATAAWQPTDPKQSVKCGSAARAGPQYEDLSIRTGGLRFPVCETGSYDAVFQAAAQDVIASAEIACEFTPAAPPTGQVYDRAYIEYTPGNMGPVELFFQVADPSACDANGFTKDASTGKITLCPATCAKVKADETAKLTVLYACSSTIG